VHVPIPWHRKTSLDLCFIAFSSRELVSTPLENALEHVLKKGAGFFDPDMLKLFDFELRPRAFSDPIESENVSRSLFYRIFFTRTGVHFA
jgi:hypothetical protein